MKKLYEIFKNNNKSGVSLITLIITIVVIIILSLIAMSANSGTIDDAALAEFKYELKGIEISVSSKRTANQDARNGRRI